MRQVFTTSIIFCCCLQWFTSFGQINAEFTVNVRQGCSPFVVNFINQSTGPITGYHWNFGNGNTSDTITPSAAYITPGTYTVTLTVYGNAGQVDSVVKQNYITVFANPAADFSAATTIGCAPKTIQFTDLSVQGSAPITSWHWDFGDGGTSNQSNPSHNFQATGLFTVSLTLTDANGCTHFIFKEQYIQITSAPVASFNGTNLNACKAPLTVNFTNSSFGVAPFSYRWDFGDGSSDTVKDPSHTYNLPGNYSVKLVVTDAGGCSDSLTRNGFVRIDAPIARMVVNPQSGCTTPSTLFQFADSSIGVRNFIQWNFGDGDVSSLISPAHTYISPGIYNVTLIVGNGACNDTVTQAVAVQQVEALFSMDKTLECRSPLNINFTDQSTNAVSWNWNFGDGTTSTNQNPSHTYLNESIDTITLTVTDTLGCISVFQQVAILDSPQVTIMPSKEDGCIPLDVVFLGAVSSADPVQSYSWDLAAGGTSTVASPQYTYTDTGEYIITLTITTNLGCTASDTFILEVGDTATIFDAYVIEDTTCRKTPANLNITSDFAEEYEGSMPGDQPDPVSIKDSSANADKSKGTVYTPITIKGIFHGCESREFTFIDTLIVIGPFCENIVAAIDCDTPFVVNFSHDGVSYQLAHWDFGDGNSSDDNQPVHTYAARGSYDVKLFLTDTITGCVFDKEASVNITVPIASFTLSDSIGCSDLTVAVDGRPSQDAAIYLWESNYPPLNFSIADSPGTFNMPAGDYYINLHIIDANFCTDSVSKRVKSYGHTTQIIPSATTGCVPFTVNFTAQVTADTTLQSYTWNINGNTFSDTAISYQFTMAGEYPVSLTTIDLNGCSRTSDVVIIAADPQANFSPNKQLACLNEQLAFLSTSTPATGLNYFWDFGDGGTSNVLLPFHRYITNDTFTVTLIVTDIYGCSDTLVRPDIIKISTPTANFTVNDTFAPCPPLSVSFTDQSFGNVILRTWQFGDNSGSVLQNPGHTYTRPGYFDVSLIVTNNIGCRDTLSIPRLIHVGGPTGIFVIDPPAGCRPLTSKFFILNQQDVAQVTWDFGDGFLGFGDSATHTYTSPGIYYPNVVLLNENNCSFSYSNIDTVMVDTITAAFTYAPQNGCAPFSVTASENSVGSIVNWTWTVGASQFTTRTIPPQSFTEPGNYIISLLVENQNGCLDSISYDIMVYGLPEIAITGDTFACQNNAAQLSATFDTNFTYQWIPPTGLDNPASPTPIATPAQSTSYVVVATDAHGCADTSDSHLLDIYPDLQVTAEPDTTIVMGDTALLRAVHNVPVSFYSWSPTNTLTCPDCQFPGAFPIDNTTYALTVRDEQGCDEKTVYVEVKVIDDIKVAMPDAFSPNGDDINDLLFVKGWNIKELIYFKIYNRWGQLVFETTDLHAGWDGTFKGEPQNMDSYAFIVKGISFKDREGEAKGTFSLIR